MAKVYSKYTNQAVENIQRTPLQEWENEISLIQRKSALLLRDLEKGQSVAASRLRSSRYKG